MKRRGTRHRQGKEPRSRLELAVPLTARAWLVEPVGSITEPVAFVWTPGSGVALLLGTCGGLALSRQLLEETCAETGAPMVITEGVDGIAATDPHWDGKPIFMCGNPQCRKVHDVHLMCAENLFKHAKKQQSSSA